MASAKIGNSQAVSVLWTLDGSDATIVDVVGQIYKLMCVIHKDKKVKIWQVFTNVKETHGLSFPLEGETVLISYLKRDKPTTFTGESYLEVIFAVDNKPTK